MSEDISQDQSLLDNLYKTIELHFENEQFGVSELAKEMGISRSQLHRRLQSITNKSASQIIREFRLKKAKEMLEKDLANVSEIAYRVGFRSPSYFITCFREFYDYSPGEAKFRTPKKVRRRLPFSRKAVLILSSVLILFAIIYFSLRLTNSFSKILNNPETIEKSIAIRTFWNESSEAENEYFVNGMVEDIRNNLAKISDLRVISRGSMEKYRETNLTTKEIASELDINYILEGTAQKIGNVVKIHAQLISANNDNHIWEKTYERDISDIKEYFSVQSNIAMDIAKQIGASIKPEEAHLIKSIPTNNTEAYQLFLKGKENLEIFEEGDRSKKGDRNLNTSIYFFQRAIDLDPNFALAYVFLGSSYFWQSLHTDYLKESFADTTKYLAEKALSINPDLFEAYNQLGYYYNMKCDDDNSMFMLEKAIDLNPNSAVSYRILSWVYRRNGQYVNAINSIKKAIKRTINDPSCYADNLSQLGAFYYAICDHEKAEIIYNQILDYDPILAYVLLSQLPEARGEWDKMKFYIDKVCSLDSGISSCLYRLSKYYMYKEDFSEALKCTYTIRNENPAGYGYILSKLNRKEEAKEYFTKQIEWCNENIRLKRTWAMEGYAYYELVNTFTFQGEKEKAIQTLREMEKNVFEGFFVWQLQVNPAYKILWEDEEFKAIISRQEKKYVEIRAEIDRLEREGEL
jgi:TolB-like protein/AraC-like DNA-binding protein